MRRWNTCTQTHRIPRHTVTHGHTGTHTVTATQEHTHMDNTDTQTDTNTVNQLKSPLPTELQGHSHLKCEIHILILHIPNVWERIIISYFSRVSL